MCWQLLSPEEQEKCGQNIGIDLMSAKISELQSEILKRTEEIESLNTTLARRSDELSASEAKVKESNDKIEVDRKCIQDQANLIKRFKRKLLLVSKVNCNNFCYDTC